MKPVKSISMGYVPDGSERGYQFESPVGKFSKTELTTIWENAFAKGRGWSDYVHSRSFKAFPLGRQIAVSTTTVTDQQDSHGRVGIRRVDVDVMTTKGYRSWLQRRWQEFPKDVTERVDQKVESLMFDLEYFFRSYPANKQIAFVHPFISPEDWQYVEALLFKISQSQGGFLRQGGFLLRHRKPLLFTTLALQSQHESRHVAIPAQCLKKLNRKGSASPTRRAYWHI